jgi:hypothetical protein
MRRPLQAGTFLLLLIALGSNAQGIRDRTRPTSVPTTLSETQAADLTLTLAPVATQEIQTWVRAAGALDAAGTRLSACVRGADAALVDEGQRVRAFPPDWRSSVYQARITQVERDENCTRVEAELARPAFERNPRFVMEIIVDRGDYLAIPNEAIIEEGDRQIVYMQHGPGQYRAHEVRTGVRGELYSEVVEGLTADTLVVTFGSFFIDAEQKLKSGTPAAASDAHQHH